MKPRIFIGCSVEGMNIAYALQENLEYNAHITIWSHNIFELSQNSLDSLIGALSKFDFAIFVFKPDDTILFRNKKKSVVRDNIIFEFGLFLGKLGKNRVFFLVPRSTVDFHIPTDLIGITPGTYDNTRSDNINASLEPFCNKIRKKLNYFAQISFSGFENYSLKIQNIILNKDENWQSELAIELLRNKTDIIRTKIIDLEDDYLYVKSKYYDENKYTIWVMNSMRDSIKLIEILQKILLSDDSEFAKVLNNDNPIKIKYVVDKIHFLINELLNWEYEFISINPPEKFNEVKSIFSLWSIDIIKEILRLPEIIENLIKPIEKRDNIKLITIKKSIKLAKVGHLLSKLNKE